MRHDDECRLREMQRCAEPRVESMPPLWLRRFIAPDAPTQWRAEIGRVRAMCESSSRHQWLEFKVGLLTVWVFSASPWIGKRAWRLGDPQQRAHDSCFQRRRNRQFRSIR
jgi:hypothetical protein